MKIDIFEKAKFSSTVTDLDLMLNYIIETLKSRDIEVNRFDFELNPEKFSKIKNYALPVIEVDGEIVCAGAYDFSFLNRMDIKKLSQKECPASKCESCPSSQFCHKNT